MTEQSICSRGADPGKCCRDFPLYSIRVEDYPTYLDVLLFLTGRPYEVGPYVDERPTRVLLSFPFVPLTADHKGIWHFRCIDLLPDGRCGNYENRPHGPCVLYEPGSDSLCKHGISNYGMCTCGSKELKPNV